MAMDWYQYLKKYVWDEQKTPFLVDVDKLNKGQADSEIFLYALFLSVPGALVGAAAVAYGLRSGIDVLALVGAYGFSVCVAAALMHARKHLPSALYSISAPVMLFAYLYFQGFHPNLAWIDQIVLIVVLLLWLRYTVRVAAIVKRYPVMPEKPAAS